MIWNTLKKNDLQKGQKIAKKEKREKKKKKKKKKREKKRKGDFFGIVCPQTKAGTRSASRRRRRAERKIYVDMDLRSIIIEVCFLYPFFPSAV